MLKRFIEWFALKEKLQRNDGAPPLVKERDIWWICFGENIGTEINGKSSLFSRPGIIIKKLSYQTFLVAPITTKMRTGTWWESIRHEGREMCICLHQIRVIDYRRLSTRIGAIDRGAFSRIKRSFLRLYS